ncbi:FG-GAP-like repeat-containing protein [[Eubacterium] cellulosolvens]
MNEQVVLVKDKARITFIWFIMLLMMVNILIVVPPSLSINKTTFADGNTQKIITFPTGGGIDESLNISIRYGAAIKSAQMNLTGLPMAGEFLSNVYLDVGGDTDFEWAFAGVGYGALGHQTVFNDSTSIINGYLQNRPYQVSSEIKIPKSANINSAQLNISGSVLEFINKMRINSSLGTVFNCELGDVDGDNDLDGIVAIRTETSPYPTEIIWCNNTAGDGSSWTNHIIANSGVTYPYGLAVGDLDGDNDLDVVVSDNDWTAGRDILWFNNTKGNGSNWTVHTVRSSIPGTSVYIYNLFIADMNNDTHNDVVGTLSNSDSNQEDIYWYSNVNGDGSSWSLHSINKTIIGARGISVGDIDGDGDNDTAITVIPTSGTDQVWWFSNNDGVGTSWTRYLINNTMSDPFNVDIADIDNDTNPDLAVLGGDNTVWFEAPDNPTIVNNWVPHNVGVGGGWGGDIAVVDVGYNYTNKEPDNNLDIIIACRSSNDVIIYKNDGSPVDGGWARININTNHESANWMAVGDINGDEYSDTLVASSLWTTTIDDLIWYEFNGGVPTNVELHLGSDAQADWVEPDTLDYKTKIPDFKNNLTQYIGQLASYFDEYGDEFVSVPLTITTDTPGRIIVTDLDIDYDFTATVSINPHGDLAIELTEALSNIPPDDQGNTTVPFKFAAGSAGQILIHDLRIEYNEFPWFIQALPTSLTLPEDSKNNLVLDLRMYVADDYIEPDELEFNITYKTGPGADKVDVGIYNNYYLSADALTGSANDNWTGYLEFIINVTDNFGSTTESDYIRLYITPVNDEPVVGPKSYSDIILLEGNTGEPIDLDAVSYFIDGDNDNLFFSVELDPEDMIPDENISFELEKATNKVTFSALGDYFGEALTVRVYCDDSEPVNLTVFQDFEITVLNINDPPHWKELPDLILDEDQVKLNAINLTNYILDPDDIPENITFSVVSNTNSESIGISINENNNVDIHPLFPEYVGSTTVTLRATDPGQNSTDGTFQVTYQPVNDAPEIYLVSPKQDSVLPSDTVILTWEASDIDTKLENLTYTVFFGTERVPAKVEGAINIFENQHTIPGLQDSTEYYWRILVEDGEDKSTLSEVSTFRVDISQRPRLKLLSPSDEAIFPDTHVTFDWELTFSGGYELTYDFYLNITEEFGPFGLLYSGLTKTELTLYELEPDQTYFWTVVPRFNTGYGISENGVFKFTIDPTKLAYGLRIQPTETEFQLHKGESYTFEVELLNLGPTDEVIQITILPKNLSYSIEILHGKAITIDAEGTRIIEFSIDTSNIIEGSYTITIIADSDKTPATDQKNITLEVLEAKEKTRDGIFSTITDFIPIIIFILIAIIGIVIVLRYKPKEHRRFADMEEESLGGETGRGTEISFKPPLEAVSGADWRTTALAPSLKKLPTIGPDTSEEEVPELLAGSLPMVEHGEIEPTMPSLAPEEPEIIEVEDEGEVPEIMLPEDLDEPVGPTTGETLPEPMPEVDVLEKVELPEFGEPLKLETVQADEVIPEPEELEPELPPKPVPEKFGTLPEEITPTLEKDEPETSAELGLTPEKIKRKKDERSTNDG